MSSAIGFFFPLELVIFCRASVQVPLVSRILPRPQLVSHRRWAVRIALVGQWCGRSGVRTRASKDVRMAHWQRHGHCGRCATFRFNYTRCCVNEFYCVFNVSLCLFLPVRIALARRERERLRKRAHAPHRQQACHGAVWQAAVYRLLICKCVFDRSDGRVARRPPFPHGKWQISLFRALYYKKKTDGRSFGTPFQESNRQTSDAADRTTL